MMFKKHIFIKTFSKKCTIFGEDNKSNFKKSKGKNLPESVTKIGRELEYIFKNKSNFGKDIPEKYSLRMFEKYHH